MRKNIMETLQEEADAILPFVMRDLVELVMQKKALPLEDALYYIYSSRLYKALLDENTKLWYCKKVHYRFMIYWKKRNQNERK